MNEVVPAGGLQGEVETPGPLRARGAKVRLVGWCLEGDQPPKAVRLVAGDSVLPARIGQARPDLATTLAGRPGAARSGFVIEGRLPPGIHLARFEAQATDGTWNAFRTYTLLVEPPALEAVIESPGAATAVQTRQHVAGWALHPAAEIKSLAIRYGHQEIPCDFGQPRSDVPRNFPDAAQAARCGFQSETILGAGRGPLRLRARLADGSVGIAQTNLMVDVPTDENHPAGFDFSGSPIRLPHGAVRHPLAAARTAAPLNILFLLPGSFAANNALHVAALANELVAAGHDCAVAVTHDLETLAHHTAPNFRAITHDQVLIGAGFANGRDPDVTHVWTTRESVRRLTEQARKRHRCRLVVHLEDNEQQLLAQRLGRPPAELAGLPPAELDALVPPDLSHPHRSRELLAAADGVTVIIDRLKEFVPPGKPTALIAPAADERYFFPRPVPAEFRQALQLPQGCTILFYHGNVHAANAAEMRELYAAVCRLNESGHATVLIRAGLDEADFLGPWAARARPHILALGQVLHHRHLPPLLSLADIFVQPGAPDAFNDYRFPSKLPEFFAIGRPVILPRTNLGLQVRHGHDAWVLDRAEAKSIADAVVAIRRDAELGERLSRGAAAYARQHFSWRQSAAELASFYATLAPSRP